MGNLQNQISGNEQKALTQASAKIAEFGAQMNLPNTVLKSAKKIYKDFETKKNVKSAVVTQTPLSSRLYISPVKKTDYPVLLKN